MPLLRRNFVEYFHPIYIVQGRITNIHDFTKEKRSSHHENFIQKASNSTKDLQNFSSRWRNIFVVEAHVFYNIFCRKIK